MLAALLGKKCNKTDIKKQKPKFIREVRGHVYVCIWNEMKQPMKFVNFYCHHTFTSKGTMYMTVYHHKLLGTKCTCILEEVDKICN